MGCGRVSSFSTSPKLPSSAGPVARYAATRGLTVLLLDRRKVIGVPVQCGEYVATNEETRLIFPSAEDLETSPGAISRRGPRTEPLR